MPTISSSKAKRTARSLSRAFRKKGIPLRRIEREGYIDTDRGIVIAPGVNHTTLSRIIKNKGAWLPKDSTILTALGLIKPRKPRRRRTLQDLTREELIALGDRLNARLGDVARELLRRKTSS